jgi:surfeit locus 1 family protein
MSWLAFLKGMVRGRQLAATLLVLLAMAVMIRLGFWQLDRLAQRRAENAVLATAIASEKIDLNNDPLPMAPEAVVDRTVIARGEYDLEAQVVLLVQNWEGRAGVHLLTPLRLEGRETAVLVDRGWVPDALYQQGNYSDFDVIGPVTVTGYGTLSETLSRFGNPEAEPDGPQSEFYRVDVARIEKQLPYPLWPFYIRQAPGADEALPYRAERSVDLTEGNHLSYAVQWFSFTIILAVVYISVVRRTVQRADEKQKADAVA